MIGNVAKNLKLRQTSQDNRFRDCIPKVLGLYISKAQD